MPMAQRFVLFYLIWLGVLFGLLYWDLSPLAYAPNEWLRLKMLAALEWGLPPGQVRGSDIWINPHYKLVIEKACNGMIPALMYLASVLAFPAGWGRRIVWGAVGAAVMLGLNLLRLFVVTWVVMRTGQSGFFYIHDLAGNALFMVAGLGMFYAFVRASR